MKKCEVFWDTVYIVSVLIGGEGVSTGGSETLPWEAFAI